jgi:hypothetical protein
MSLERRRYAGAFGGARQEALLKLVATLLLAVICGINDFFKRADALEVAGDTYLLKEIHCPLETRKLALAFGGKGAVALDAQLEWSLWWGERSGRRWDKGGSGDIGVIMMILLVLASPLPAALLLAILAVAK